VSTIDVVLGMALLGVLLVLVLPAVHHALTHNPGQSLHQSNPSCNLDCNECDVRDVCTEQFVDEEDADNENPGDCGAFGDVETKAAERVTTADLWDQDGAWM